MSVAPSLSISRREINGVGFNVLETGAGVLVECQVAGIDTCEGKREVVNSVVDSKRSETLRAWKLKVATTVRENRRFETDPIPAVISVAFMMCSENHGGRDYDIENFVKPVIDGVAMGLWGNLDAVRNDPSLRFDADDSVFSSIYLQNCPVTLPDAEGVYIVVAPWNGVQASAT